MAFSSPLSFARTFWETNVVIKFIWTIYRLCPYSINIYIYIYIMFFFFCFLFSFFTVSCLPEQQNKSGNRSQNWQKGWQRFTFPMSAWFKLMPAISLKKSLLQRTSYCPLPRYLQYLQNAVDNFTINAAAKIKFSPSQWHKHMSIV